jgi:hypothetical protein
MSDFEVCWFMETPWSLLKGAVGRKGVMVVVVVSNAGYRAEDIPKGAMNMVDVHFASRTLSFVSRDGLALHVLTTGITVALDQQHHL